MEPVYRILIVDDEVDIRDTLSAILTAKGYVCETASCAAEALEKAGASAFDAVITDIKMPGMDGIALMREIVKRHPGLPVMIMTGFAAEYYEADALEAGAEDFIGKPFHVKELIMRVERLCRGSRILNEIRKRKEEIESISREMIEGLQEDSRLKIEELERQIRELRGSA